ncbi:MAG TPA: antitoxin family protein [Chloroflexota bacterium]|nr:antitoxin family protein [Chloroflexota bacterium]
MAQTVRATYDGEVLRPEGPVDLRPNATYVITIEDAPAAEGTADEEYPLTAIGRLATDMGLTDLSIHHDRYAHGRSADEHGGA